MTHRITLAHDINGGRKGPFNSLDDAFEDAWKNNSSGIYKASDGKFYYDNYGQGHNAGDVIETHFYPENGKITFLTGNHSDTCTIDIGTHKVERIHKD